MLGLFCIIIIVPFKEKAPSGNGRGRYLQLGLQVISVKTAGAYGKEWVGT